LEESLQHNGYYEDPGYSINEYQEDCVITTSLINTSFPLIRYKVDDILVRKEVNNVQEVGHPTIERIHGRTTDCIIGKDGTHFSGAALSYFAKAIPNISTVQLIQEEVGKMFVHLVPDTNFSTNDEAKITGVVREILGADNIDYSVRKISVEELQYAKNGKLSLIVSKIKK
jgi:phenylacetate-CoA ligase